MEGDLSQRLRERVAYRFAHLNPEFDEPSWCIVRIAGPAGGVGQVAVENPHDVGLIVHVGNFTHGHFDEGVHADDAVEACCDFLDDLISDKVAVWGSATEGGWIYLRVMPAVPPDDAMYTWSGRWWP